MDAVDKQIINILQRGFPICDRPYHLVALELGLTEQSLIDRLQVLLAEGVLSRFGPLYNAECMGGALTLAAVKAPEEQYESVAGMINSLPEVAHNYARNHSLNMWFVIATPHPEQIAKTIETIENLTGLTVYSFPKLREYFVNLQLEA